MTTNYSMNNNTVVVVVNHKLNYLMSHVENVEDKVARIDADDLNDFSVHTIIRREADGKIIFEETEAEGWVVTYS